MINKWLKINFGIFCFTFFYMFFCLYIYICDKYCAFDNYVNVFKQFKSLHETYTYIYVSSCYIKEKKNVSSFFKTKIMNNCQEIVHRKSII